MNPTGCHFLEIAHVKVDFIFKSSKRLIKKRVDSAVVKASYHGDTTSRRRRVEGQIFAWPQA